MSIKTLLFAVGALTLAACHDLGRPVGPTTDPDVPQMEPALQAHTEQTFEHPDVAKLVGTVPGFGGFYLDGGVPTVYLTDVGQRAKAEAALAAHGRVRVLQGDYTYQQLGGWFRRLSPEALALPGAVLVDLDEARNRVFVGVEHAGAAAAVRGVAARLGLPPGAVVVEVVEPIHRTSTLYDHVRPLVGGLEIQFGVDWVSYGDLGTCTLGFNAIQSGQTSFITNSHCTWSLGMNRATTYYQGLDRRTPSLLWRAIGVEVEDPLYFTGSRWFGGTLYMCPQGRMCRFSDAARVAYTSGVSGNLGRIARTSSPNTCPNLADDPPIRPDGHPCLDTVGEFQIIGEGAAVKGMTVNKVGRTTGWTQGKVAETCVDFNVVDDNLFITEFCQNSVYAGFGPGDSGSPVFTTVRSTLPDGTRISGVLLLGILHGGDRTESKFYFSPIANIEWELGLLTTY